MAKSPKKPQSENIETRPDAWERFKQQMDKIVPPKKPRKNLNGKKKSTK